ncbi:hypothetical protein SOASR030_35290 [Leminorella grimontii]|uniref:Uncharacterized protein n=1 Tax=Leminorella grimontii TaxID=82981 RepID=A0AAV5N9E7_9GAMM|nr:hypothetical protein SOASR030_35290 [Leminorella grimontii]
MSTHDILHAVCVCPRCEASDVYEIEAFFPSGNLCQYQLKDELINVTKNRLQESFTAEGYVECPHCKKDFFVDIRVKDNVILSVSVSSKNGYIP